MAAVASVNWCVAEEPSDRLFAGLDANADGQVTSQEAGKQHRLLFRRLLRTSDENRDGKLNARELATGLEPVRADKAPVEKLDSRLPGSDALLVLVAKMDAHADRQLEADEIPGDYKATFARMLELGDANKDGRLESREIAQAGPQLALAAAMEAGRRRMDVPAELARLSKSQLEALTSMDAYARPAEMMAGAGQVDAMFARWDANGDKLVSPEEAPGPFADRLQKMMPRIDRDGDGKLSKAEFTEMARRLSAFEQPVDPKAVKRTVRQLLKRFDRDGNGQLSVQEVPRRMAANFDRSDQDANGQLDASELETAAQTINRLERGAAMGPAGGFAPPRMVAGQAGKPGKKGRSASSAGAVRREKQRKKRSQD
jgi:Ca2+-binding EF-hand superfamily protein